MILHADTEALVDKFPAEHRAALDDLLPCFYGRVALVGGAVRDLLFGLPPRDLDLVVEMTTPLEPLLGGRVVERTSLGGFRLQVVGVPVDIWRTIDNAIGPPCATIESVVQHGFTLDVDLGSLILRGRHRGLLDAGMVCALRSRREVDLVRLLRDIESRARLSPLFTLVRASSMIDRYDLRFGPILRSVVERRTLRGELDVVDARLEMIAGRLHRPRLAAEIQASIARGMEPR